MSANPTSTNKCSHYDEEAELLCSSSFQASSQRGSKRKSVCSVACQTDNQYAAPLNSQATSGAANPCGSSQESTSPNVKVCEQKKPSASTQKTLPADQDDAGLIKLAIPNFQSISDTICSASTRIRGVPWRIMIMPKQHLVSKKNQKCMGFFLQCCPDKTYSDAWSCKADAEMRLVSQKQGVANFVRKTTHTYTAKENDWGYSCFMTWADIVDETQGYIKDDKIFLEITVKSEFAKNMMTREEFCKSIDQWFNLAEMQMSRGLVDLALEANNQALKFCKDRDEEMKKKLDEQKSTLVKKKVLDSIDRLENKKEIVKPTEPLKPTSLRQALTGTQKTISTKGAVKTTSKKDRRATLQQMKKKKQDLAAKEKELKQKTAEWDEIQNQLSSMSSDEQKNSASPSPTSETDRCTCGGKICLANDKNTDGYPSSSGSVVTDDEDSPPSGAAAQTRELIYEPTSPTYSTDKFSPKNRVIYDFIREQNGRKFEVHVDAVFPDEEQAKRFLEERPIGARPSDDCEEINTLPVSTDDDSDDYQEGAYNDEEYADGEINDSISSAAEEEDIMEQHWLDPDAVSVVECSCQTEESGDAVAVTQRQRRPAGSGSTVADPSVTFSEKFKLQMNTLHYASVDVQKHLDSAVPTPDAVDGKVVEYKVCSLVKDITGMAQNSLDCFAAENDTQSMNQPSVKFGDDHALCLLSAGICTVQARKVFFQVTGLSDFLAKMHDTEAKDHSKLKQIAPDCVLEASKTVSKSNGRAIVTAVRRKPLTEQNPHKDFEVSLDEPCANSIVSLSDGPESEIEASIRSLLADVDYPRVLSVIAQKLTTLLSNEPADRKVLPLLVQLFEYSQALSVTGDCLQHAVDRIKSLYRRGMNARAMEAIKISEQQMKEVKEQMSKFEVDAQKAKKLYLQLESALNEEKTKHNETEVLLNNQLKDCRNQLKKIEKKTKQEENRNATLSAEKLDLEDRLKNVRKELDQLKKKSTDERNKLKKEKEKDAEVIKRLQVELSDKDTEKEREKHSLEEKIREGKSRETKLEKEKKQSHQAASTNMERAKAAETCLLELQLEVGLKTLEKTKSEALTTKIDAEDLLKKARSQSEMDMYRKSIIEWQSAIDDIDRLIEKSKAEYNVALESVSKGVKTFANFSDLKVPPPPCLPKVVKLPPVQVVQPSTPTYHAEPPAAPIIPAIAAGVIGQPRTPRGENRRMMENASGGNFNRQQSPPAPIPTVHKILPPPSSSPWSFLDNVSDMFRPNEAVQGAANHGHFDLWNAQEMGYPVQQSRNVYQQHQANNWAQQHGNWRVPTNHGMPPPNQGIPQMRASNGMPYYDNQMG